MDCVQCTLLYSIPYAQTESASPNQKSLTFCCDFLAPTFDEQKVPKYMNSSSFKLSTKELFHQPG
jgi:hypothetical protein